MPTLLLGVWGYVAAAVIAAAASSWAVHEIDNGAYQSLKANYAAEDAARTAAALKQFTDIANTMHKYAGDFNAANTTLGTTLDTISKDLKNVQAKTPLPNSCHPDAGRLRSLTAAVAAANSSFGQ